METPNQQQSSTQVANVQTVTFNNNIGMQTALDIAMDPNSTSLDFDRARTLVTLSREYRIARKHSTTHYRSLEYKVYPEPEPVNVTEHDLPSEEDFGNPDAEGRDDADYDAAQGDEGFSSANLS